MVPTTTDDTAHATTREHPMEHQTHPQYGLDAQLHTLDDGTCRDLLAGTVVGRLVWHGDDGLSVITVNHALDGPDILVRLAPWSRAARECDRAAVAFHVDQTDPSLRTGWSVLARGRARVDLMPALTRGARVDVWPDGIRPVSLRIEVDRLTGRQLGAPA